MVSATGSHRATTPSCTSRPKCRRYTVSPPSRISPRSIGLMSVIRARSTESTALRWGRDGPAATAGRRDPGARRSPPRAGGRRLSDGRRLLRHGAPQPRRDPDRRGGAHDRHAPLRRRRGLADGGARAAVLLRRARVLRAVRGPERRAHARQAGAGNPRRDGERAPRHARRSHLGPTVELRMAAELARRFEARVPRRTTDTEAYLATLLAEEQRKRRSRFATRARERGAGRTAVAAERFVARKRAAWEAFRAVATRAERAGVGALPPDEIPAFRARYREAAADLARARTYRSEEHTSE